MIYKLSEQVYRTTDYELDLSEEGARLFGEQYEKGKVFFKGKWIDSQDIEEIEIRETDSKSSGYWPSLTFLTIFQSQKYSNVTRKFIKSPPKKEEFSEKKERAKQLLSKNVFIVHGRDHKPVKELKTMLLEFGLNPIVLHEQASGSMTIAEKIERYLDDVGYSFTILTPDDLGCFKDSYVELFRECFPKKDESEDRKKEKWRFFFTQMQSMLRNRARQNVILEFGCCWGKLGRKKVCCLYKGDVDFPSDMQGIVYIPFTESVHEVRDMIMKELKEAGYEIKL
jgi:predicted nucleotide-binding protein